MLEIRTGKRYVYIKSNIIENITEYYIAASWTGRAFLAAPINLLESIRFDRHYMTEEKSDRVVFTNKEDAQFIIDFIVKCDKIRSDYKNKTEVLMSNAKKSLEENCEKVLQRELDKITL